MPSLPIAAVDALRLLQDPDADIMKLLRPIEHDPWLTSNLLRAANSAYFGGRGTIGSVRDALVRLGTKRLHDIIIATTISPLIRRPVKGYDLPPGELWKHSVAVAVGTEQLALALRLKPTAHAFTSGLLHDIGKIVLGVFLDVDASTILELAYEEKLSFDMAEEAVLGVNHAEVGSVLLANWNLPHCIVEATRCHHRPELLDGDSIVAELVHVADALCMMAGIGIGKDGLNYRSSRKVVSGLNVTTLVAETAICGIVSGMNELRDLFTAGIERV
jgi:HD-like signal output (HDOD) protein